MTFTNLQLIPSPLLYVGTNIVQPNNSATILTDESDVPITSESGVEIVPE